MITLSLTLAWIMGNLTFVIFLVGFIITGIYVGRIYAQSKRLIRAARDPYELGRVRHIAGSMSENLFAALLIFAVSLVSLLVMPFFIR